MEVSPKTWFMPEGASSIAEDVDWLFYFITWMSVVFFVIITVCTVYFLFKYRRKPGEKPGLTIPLHHNTALEAVWTVIPTILIFFIFIWGFRSFMDLFVIPAGAEEIRVQAAQWNWTFRHNVGGSGNESKSNNLHVPVGRPIKLHMSSSDVLHSLFIPDFRVKMDIIPNRTTSLWFTALEEGEYDLYCTEYCGEKHSKMLGRVYAMSEADYTQWVLDNAKAGTGKEIYDTKCSVCHSLEAGNTEKAPTWRNLYGRTEKLSDGTTIKVLDDYIRESIRYPHLKIVAGFETQTSMSPFPKQSVSYEEVDNIILFMKSLSDHKADEVNEDPKP